MLAQEAFFSRRIKLQSMQKRQSGSRHPNHIGIQGLVGPGCSEKQAIKICNLTQMSEIASRHAGAKM